MVEYMGAKVFTATKAREREELGDHVTHWLRENPQVTIKNTTVTQSSDSEFHCLTIIVFFDYEDRY
jgi:hypothetical protein